MIPVIQILIHIDTLYVNSLYRIQHPIQSHHRTESHAWRYFSFKCRTTLYTALSILYTHCVPQPKIKTIFRFIYLLHNLMLMKCTVTNRMKWMRNDKMFFKSENNELLFQFALYSKMLSSVGRGTFSTIKAHCKETSRIPLAINIEMPSKIKWRLMITWLIVSTQIRSWGDFKKFYW